MAGLTVIEFNELLPRSQTAVIDSMAQFPNHTINLDRFTQEKRGTIIELATILPCCGVEAQITIYPQGDRVFTIDDRDCYDFI